MSDADVVVVYSGMRGSTFYILKRLCNYASSLAVPLEFIPLDHTFATQGAHFWTPSFTLHVKWAEENGGLICGQSITDDITPRIERKNEGLDYAISKLQKILKKMTLLLVMNEKERFGLFTEVVQVPMFLARKVVWDAGVKLSLDSKAKVVDAYLKVVSAEEAALFKELGKLSAYYRALVESRPEAEYYRAKIEEKIGEAGLEKLVRYLEVTIKNILWRME